MYGLQKQMYAEVNANVTISESKTKLEYRRAKVIFNDSNKL